MQITRRRFLAYGAAAGASIVASGSLWAYLSGDTDERVPLDDGSAIAERADLLEAGGVSPSAARLVALLPSAEDAAAVGEQALAEGVGGGDTESLVERLTPVLIPEGGPTTAAGFSAARETLRQRIAEDFAEERVDLVDGWLLSETLIELCVLAARVQAPYAASGRRA